MVSTGLRAKVQGLGNEFESRLLHHQKSYLREQMWEANGCAAGQPKTLFIDGDYSEIPPRGVAGVTELSPNFSFKI